MTETIAQFKAWEDSMLAEKHARHDALIKRLRSQIPPILKKWDDVAVHGGDLLVNLIENGSRSERYQGGSSTLIGGYHKEWYDFIDLYEFRSRFSALRVAWMADIEMEIGQIEEKKDLRFFTITFKVRD